jgi:general secretion pathway protein A
MYEPFYGLHENPFRLTANPRYAYLTDNHKVAITKGRFVVEGHQGIALVVGEIGTGKSTIAQLLVNGFAERNFCVGFIESVPADSSVNNFLRQIIRAFDLPKAKSSQNQRELIQDFLVEQYRKQETLVLIIDDSQTMNPKQLEELRQIQNFEHPDRKLLQLVLLGQMELMWKIKDKPNFKSRIATVATLDPLMIEEMQAMIQFRLQVAGLKPSQSQLFTEEAYREIWRLSQGIPRNTCVLCNNALLLGYAKRITTIDGATIQEAGQELKLAA